MPESFQQPNNWVTGFVKGYPLLLFNESQLPPLQHNLERRAMILALACCALPQPRAFQKWWVLPKKSSWSVRFSFPSPVCHCHEKLQVRAAMLTWVNGRITDNIRNYLLNFGRQTCSLQVDRVASFHRLEQVSANLRKTQRSALTYSPLGKQRQKELRWQKCLKYNWKLKTWQPPIPKKQSGDNSTQQCNKAPQNTLLLLVFISFLFQLVKSIFLLRLLLLSSSATSQLALTSDEERFYTVRPPQRLTTACL